ncbi:hypothetical protein AXF42_Ash005316 [Apostasia shenzhenica]|uniref:Uncharacterized protein n=1 Tax=Apostasia shenzhenica TaxID=1088818 RepID=A0A2I0B6M9_9ASPA|nr:hypothetical protein AXF42_Ash005316 [Apostasia shenzhenica]
MEDANAVFTVSSLPERPDSADSSFSSLLYDLSHQVQDAMQNMHKMARYFLPFRSLNHDVHQSCGEIMEEINKCKESAAAKSKTLEEDKDRFQKAAMAVLQMLNGSDIA